jgi:hypothetical protein
VEAFLDVGRTFGLMILGLVALIGCIILYESDKTTGATALLSVAEAILFTGFGVQVGERAGSARASGIEKGYELTADRPRPGPH